MKFPAQRTPNDEPIGRFRFQILSSDQTPKIARLAYFFDYFASQLGGISRMWCLSRGRRISLKHGDVESFGHNSLNEVELQAAFPATSPGSINLGIDSATAKLLVSPTSEVWANPDDWRGKGKAEIRRVNYHLRGEFVARHQFNSYPSLLDMVVFRSKARTEQDARLFFDVVTKGLANVGLDMIQFACGDFNRRTDDVLVQAERMHIPPGEIGTRLDQGHEILLVNAALAKKLQAEISGNQFLEVRALSRGLTALLFAGDFLTARENRRLFQRFGG